ncbi:MAG TPA: hypothetical protein VGG45_16465 [Terracidiphilus sp.]|jgi:hypothetical protein
MWPFKRKAKEPILLLSPRPDADLYEIGGGWSDRISWWSENQLTRVYGHKTPKPRAGDVLTCEMKSGKTGVWIFQSIEHCNDPPDMFFADVNPIGYTDEIAFSLPTPPQSPFAEAFQLARRL